MFSSSFFIYYAYDNGPSMINLTIPVSIIHLVFRFFSKRGRTEEDVLAFFKKKVLEREGELTEFPKVRVNTEG